MSEHPHGATTIRASKGSGSKWLIGAIAAAVLLGGGYAAWTVFGPAQQGAEMSHADPYGEQTYEDAPLRAAPLEPQDLALADPAMDDPVAAQASSSPRPAARRATARPAPVPEEIVGVTPASLTPDAARAQDGEDIVVRAGQRPVWVRRPSERRLNGLYPVRALERGREGEARLACTVMDGGALDCVRAEETGREFGTAALRVARAYRHAPTRADGGSAVGTPVNLHVVFRLEDDERRRFASR